MKWFKTQFPGVRYREHPTRKHGVRKDRYFALHYKVNGVVKDEPWGWASEGKTAEGAFIRLSELKANAKRGAGPTTLKERRETTAAKAQADKEAEEAKAKAQAEERRTLSEYWKETYFPAAKLSKKESSWEKEDQHFRRWIEPLLGELALKSIGLKQWDELVKALANAGRSQRMKEYVTGTLRRILRHAYDRRMVDDAPPTGKRVGVAGPGNNRRLRVIDHEEEQAIMGLLATCDPHAWRITRFCFLTGCRASEAFSLTRAGLDFSRGMIVFSETKNRDTRTIPMTPPLRALLEPLEQSAADAYVFVKENGAPYLQSPSAFETVVDKLELNDSRTKRDRLVFHSIRHTVATRLAQRLGPRDLMDVMGWRTVQMAMRYIHANEDAKMKALSMLGAAPGSGKLLPFRASEGA